ncbi:MAG: hypothetical protein HQL52_02100 [Magnetococcales bacterium]|nr:hypothetical protein [Magnetococcales bacterium]
MERLHIDIEDNGYTVFDDQQHQALIQGIQDYAVACELHEMLEGELEAENDEVFSAA